MSLRGGQQPEEAIFGTDPKSKIEDQKSKIKNQRSKIEDRKSKIENQKLHNVTFFTHSREGTKYDSLVPRAGNDEHPTIVPYS